RDARPYPVVLSTRRAPLAPTASDAPGPRASSSGRLQPARELGLEQAVLVDLAVDRARLEQLHVAATRGDSTVVEDDDLVRERDRREAVRDDQGRPLARRLAQAGTDPGLRRRVDRGGRVVEYEDARVDDERA